MGVRGTFYFRYPKTFRREIVEEVAQRGHEVGYHYEVLTKARGDIEGALRLFRQELEVFREVVDVTSACMHGAPLSRWHNLDIWKSANPIDFGLVGEAYLSIDWDATFYLTDTGRGWNLSRAAVRDVAGGRSRLSFPSTRALADALTAGELPDRIAVTIHPERWVDSAVVATWDTLVQRCKNLVKGVVVDRLPVARE